MLDTTNRERERSLPSQWIGVVLAFAGLVLVSGALVLLIHHDDPPTAKFVSAESAAKSGKPVVNLGEMFIEGDLKIKAGATIVVVNTGSLPDTLTIEGGPRTSDIAGDKAEELDTSKLAPGSYTVYCTIEGHRALGMEATLVVE
jgi:plastocyanin